MNLRDELEAIRDRHGELTPKAVVAEARDPGHPLHSRFEWDDAVAGEAYRLDQARGLIRKVRITYVEATDKSPAKQTRFYQSVRTETGSSYRPSPEIAADPFQRKLVLADMEREWQALKRRYADFAEFAEMVRRDIAS